MTVGVIGEVSLGTAIPGVNAALATAMADIQAKVTALAQFQPVPPELNASIALCGEMIANLSLAVSIGITPPSLEIDVVLLAQLTALKVQLQILLDLAETLRAAVHVYRYDGAVNAFGTEMQAQLSAGLPGGSGSDVAMGLTLVATAGADVAAMRSLFQND